MGALEDFVGWIIGAVIAAAIVIPVMVWIASQPVPPDLGTMQPIYEWGVGLILTMLAIILIVSHLPPR